jgi:hypothetical protein
MCSFSRDELIRTIDERRVASVAAKIARKISTAFDAAKHPAKFVRRQAEEIGYQRRQAGTLLQQRSTLS